MLVLVGEIQLQVFQVVLASFLLIGSKARSDRRVVALLGRRRGPKAALEKQGLRVIGGWGLVQCSVEPPVGSALETAVFCLFLLVVRYPQLPHLLDESGMDGKVVGAQERLGWLSIGPMGISEQTLGSRAGVNTTSLSDQGGQ